MYGLPGKLKSDSEFLDVKVRLGLRLRPVGVQNLAAAKKTRQEAVDALWPASGTQVLRLLKKRLLGSQKSFKRPAFRTENSVVM